MVVFARKIDPIQMDKVDGCRAIGGAGLMVGEWFACSAVYIRVRDTLGDRAVLHRYGLLRTPSKLVQSRLCPVVPC